MDVDTCMQRLNSSVTKNQKKAKSKSKSSKTKNMKSEADVLETIIQADEPELEKKAAAAALREFYSKIKADRDKATFAMMMRMNPEALTNIRKEFFVRQDETDINEFIFVIQRHLNRCSEIDIREQREFAMKL